MTTLVLCVDRTNDIGRKTGLRTPVSGWEAVQSLVVDVGLADPEDTSVNCLLEALRVARDLRDEREEAVVAVVSGESDSLVGADRSVAAQLDELVETYDPESVVVVVDSAEDERLVPVIESRLRVDAVDRIVVRQARDIESTYYLLKQFLADEELRQTVLVPMGIGLLLLPLLLLRFESPALAGAFIASLLGAVLLYKGLAIGERLASVPERTRDALYSGQVSVVTYVVAAGLTLVGIFLGGLEVSALSTDYGVVVAAIQFTYSSVPWLALAALTASTGRLVDELIQNDEVGSPYWNLPFGVVALGLVVRGFTGWYLERQEIIQEASIPGLIESVPATYRLAAFIVAGLVISIVGVAVASNVADETLDVR
ncbi:hypothetical protein AUR64_09415 [Haloprofundus marisrubri]|uniref:DUF373 family protein n=1 Tax=Haloprofundus marisrubri TaxID=1514971 RepID=A0A0W1R946_9EURY|nr:DUF373 family protein [Haloprofundus marisrubri]KTG09838.1 hypothetical protein AUR64_09415 [Haloprofundus marisrubri]